MLVEGFPAQVAGTNCWIVAAGPGEQCVVVDPGVGVQGQLDELIARHRLHPVAVLLTHGHFDHTFSVLPVCQARDVPAWIHPSDRDQLTDPWTAVGMAPGTPFLGNTSIVVGEPDDVRELSDGQVVEIAGLEFAVSHTPGHTPGSVVFGLAELLFSGDVLFAGSIGRSDFPTSSTEAMMTSLRDVILPMQDDTIVHPGHGPSTTIGRERSTNPFLRGLS